ncbi:hypothetical protein BAE36_14025 [Rhizobium leguminosarum bv. trifolii]|jgi:uncharacterized membrane-anchored protein|uniref:Membrane protein n=3 Tax=Rhizobium leguminosarum TaxID=384 RepID=A0A1B8RCY6_RHILT|nr:DUF3422 domain-containing protein [Rhizobium leguminosarum]AOO90568.1 membrane protein [Rhizobium leguminosarum bv. trifolii]MBY5474413.1 DUF3422 domain-containing protein [Rhizobium leguminosarum]MBY5496052.1 DUF3422 domain-containing protein [Rhizobium leguminosarum]MBY5509936.1 DUF3422 domain-containing protein [Rhizobium leguminosarum]MBY5516697.1 DUF3422 domain-containing protein [Rhizobium leguminosarum]
MTQAGRNEEMVEVTDVDLDFNAELHARPSIYFSGQSFVEHIALRPATPVAMSSGHRASGDKGPDGTVQTQIEVHTEFVTVTRVTKLLDAPAVWPTANLTIDEARGLSGLKDATLICRLEILVSGAPPRDISSVLTDFAFADTAASIVGGGALVCSDFRVSTSNSSRAILFNTDLNAYRLGRMVRRVYEIETYRVMALLGLPEARRLGPLLADYDRKLVGLTNRHLTTPTSEHRSLLEEISILSAQVISATAETRNRFGATIAYAKIVEERIAELRESHVPGFQRYGVFVARRFKPAIRTCEATAVRLEQLSHATMHLIDLLQTRIQVEIEYQNAVQIQAMAERAATQVKIQRAVEGFSILAISYYLLSLIKLVLETSDHAGYHIDPLVMLICVPVVIGAVCITVLRVKHALKS